LTCTVIILLEITKGFTEPVQCTVKLNIVYVGIFIF